MPWDGICQFSRVKSFRLLICVSFISSRTQQHQVDATLQGEVLIPGKCRMHHRCLIVDSTSEQAFQTAMKPALVAKRWVDWLVHLCQSSCCTILLGFSVDLPGSYLHSPHFSHYFATQSPTYWEMFQRDEMFCGRHCLDGAHSFGRRMPGGIRHHPAISPLFAYLRMGCFPVVLLLNTCEHVKGLRDLQNI